MQMLKTNQLTKFETIALQTDQVGRLRQLDFYIADWLVEPQTNQISRFLTNSRGGKTPEIRSLEPRVMLLLCALAANAGKVVSRETLINYLWPRVIVNENSLTRAVSELRKALKSPSTDNDDINATPLIATVSKAGYRLTASVSIAGQNEVADTIPVRGYTQPSVSLTTVSTQSEATNSKFRAAVALAACLTVTTVVLAWQLLVTTQMTQVQLLAMTEALPIDMNTRNTEEVATATGNVGADINLSSSALAGALRSGSVEARSTSSISADNDVQYTSAGNPLISRDGELFAFISYTDAGSSLMLGSPDTYSSPVNVYETDELIYNLQWSPVENVLLFAQRAKLSPASLLLDDANVRLVMFDIATLTATILRGVDVDDEATSDAVRKHFSLT